MDRVAPLPAAGELLADKYRVERELGQGSLGPVFGAVHVSLHQPVAIKFLRPSLIRHEVISRRFMQEARAAVSIRSEHVGRVLDLAVTEHGVPYMVMEALYGTDLGEVLRERKTLPIEDAAGYLLQVCDAMAEAHALGIVHRDLKPENLFLIARADGTQIIKVLDFGVSKASIRLARLDGEGDDGEGTAVTTVMTHPTRPTDTHAIIGSLGYMAPEQIGNAKVVDARADIWSIGVILYELLAGELPFKGASEASLARAILLEPAPLLVSTVPEAPEKISELVARCLEKDPSKRIAEVAQVRDVLVEFASREARAAANMPRAYPAGTRAADEEFARRRHGLTASPGASMKSAPAEVVASTGSHRRDARVRSLAAAVGVLIVALAAVIAFSRPPPPTPAVTKLSRAVDASGWAARAAAHAREAASLAPPVIATTAPPAPKAAAPKKAERPPSRVDREVKNTGAPAPQAAPARDRPAAGPAPTAAATAAAPPRAGGSRVDPLANAD